MEVDLHEPIRRLFFRDGSIGIAFVDSEGVHRDLILNNDYHASEKLLEGAVYKSAEIHSFIKSEYKSPVTGVSYPKTDVSKSPISWKAASDLLNQMEKMKSTYDTESTEILEWMQKIVSNEKHFCIF